MLKRKGYSMMLLVLLLIAVACELVQEVAEPVPPPERVEMNVTSSQPTEEPVMQSIEPVILDSEQAVLEQLHKILEK